MPSRAVTIPLSELRVYPESTGDPYVQTSRATDARGRVPPQPRKEERFFITHRPPLALLIKIKINVEIKKKGSSVLCVRTAVIRSSFSSPLVSKTPSAEHASTRNTSSLYTPRGKIVVIETNDEQVRLPQSNSSSLHTHVSTESPRTRARADPELALYQEHITQKKLQVEKSVHRAFFLSRGFDFVLPVRSIDLYVHSLCTECANRCVAFWGRCRSWG